MNKPVRIDSSNKIDYNIEMYIKPEFVYVPLENKNGTTYKYLVKEGDYVYKGMIVAINKDNNFPVHSSVSGYAVCGTNKLISNGKRIKCVVIENDFKEKYEKSKLKSKDINSYTKELFINDLRDNGISGLGGADYPTFLKYSMDNIRCLIVNGVECEPFVSCDKAVMTNYADSILEAIDNILEIVKIPRAIIAVKSNDIKSIRMFNKYIKTYPNISLRLVEDAFPNGWERLVVRNTLGIEYDKYPSEKGIIVNNVSTIYAIYEMFKYNRPLTERVITITGPGIKKKKNVKVKIGALASDIISNLDGYKNIKNPLFIVGGPMMGKSMPCDDVVITKDVTSIIVMEDHFEKNLPCIKCGKCTMVCPANIMPVLIMENIDNIDNLKKLKCNKCIGCSLCSYICPSKIEVREFVNIAKEKVNHK
jgi:electron transport complex, rnfABCDGE type, C subunit